MYRSSLRFYCVFFGESLKIAKPPRELLPFLTKILRISSEETRQRKIRAHENSEVVPNIINEASKNSILLNFIRQSGIDSGGERSCRESPWKGDKRQGKKTRGHVTVGEKTHHPELKVEKARTRPERKIVSWKTFCIRYVYSQIICFTLHHNP